MPRKPIKAVYTPACDGCGRTLDDDDKDQMLCAKCRARIQGKPSLASQVEAMEETRARSLLTALLEVLWPIENPDVQWSSDELENLSGVVHAYGITPPTGR